MKANLGRWGKVWNRRHTKKRQTSGKTEAEERDVLGLS